MLSPTPDILATWPTPNYLNLVTRGHGVLTTNIIICALSTVAVGLRLYTRIRITHTLGLDDAFSVLGLVGLPFVRSLSPSCADQLGQGNCYRHVHSPMYLH
jgi:hypothetical protein